MSISLACQHCGYISTTPDGFAGHQICCRKCGAPSEVPTYSPVARRLPTMVEIARVIAFLATVVLLVSLTAPRDSSARHRRAKPAPTAPAAAATPARMPYDSALRAAVVAYLNPDDARGLDAALNELGKVMAGRGQPATRGELLAGFLALAAEKQGRTGQRPKGVRFRDSFGESYKACRTPGMTHDQAVARLAELRKF